MRVIIESPYAPRNGRTLEQNLAYSRRALADSLARGESPVAFHLLYTQVLDDFDPIQRTKGILASERWYAFADRVAVYADHGISPGMMHGLNTAGRLGLQIEYRYIGPGAGGPTMHLTIVSSNGEE